MYLTSNSENRFEGNLELKRSGNAIVLSNINNIPQTIIIRKNDLQFFRDHDHVSGIIYESNVNTDGKIIYYGHITSEPTYLNETMQGVVTGFYQRHTMVYSPLLGRRMQIWLKTDTKLNIYDRVSVIVKEFNKDINRIIAELDNFTPIYSISNKTADAQLVSDLIDINRIPYDHSHINYNMSSSSSSKIISNPLKVNRVDLTSLETFSIDKSSTIDIDDALSFKFDDKGIMHFYIHIADVSEYVFPDSPYWDETVINASSIYVNDNTFFPMLPQEIQDMCSLFPRQRRNALTSEFILQTDGTTRFVGYYFSVIKSTRAFSYTEADRILQSRQPSFDYKLLAQMEYICKCFSKQSITFINNTHDMIEKYMILFNMSMTKYLKPNTAIFREQATPTDIQTKPILNYLKYIFNKNDNNNNINTKLTDTQKDILQHLLSKSKPKAKYNIEANPHYSMGEKPYAQVSSPIRRLADLVNICNIRGHTFDKIELESYIKRNIAADYTQSEVDKQLAFYQNIRTNNQTNKMYDAIVIDITNVGLYAFIPSLNLVCFLHQSKFNDSLIQKYDEITVNMNKFHVETHNIDWILKL